MGFYTICTVRWGYALGEIVQSTQSCWTASEQDLNIVLKYYLRSSTKDNRRGKA